jgi:ATP-dependent DNA helicase RecQ
VARRGPAAAGQGLLAVEGDYGTLVLTDASAEVLRGDRKVMMRREPSAPRPRRQGPHRRGAPAVDLPAEAAPVFERLRAWRARRPRSRACPRT